MPVITPSRPVTLSAEDARRHRQFAEHIRRQRFFQDEARRPKQPAPRTVDFQQLVINDDTGELEALTCALD